MGGGFGDLDNNGLARHSPRGRSIGPGRLGTQRLFRDDRGPAFQDVTTSAGLGQLQKDHGVAFVDMNNDGQKDIFAETGGVAPGDSYQSGLYANPGHPGYRVTLELQGVQSNRSALGGE